ncbi:TetR/AcrR family transcriptional regulator [Rhodococcus sp. HNM0569]|uniref:TetR/AcrR family transcriptional regulator n=1 Tax=Rhodococcus sp. HNM0569 TaxID=2716340 RepID=UPI00146CA059|nr:TetR/AcrR family transcriptional regulator [Rhodococcus sp. HNM0569]NLU82373.1 TetR/AcrR family transcriptional regulator [Rhodococcus sp. HNM0569]
MPRSRSRNTDGADPAPLQQERARRTRAAIVESAAHEFARRGYTAASVNAILEGSGATKGAMYFHFASKEALARAVLDAGRDRFVELTSGWSSRGDADPFELLHGLLVDLARLFESDAVVRAEFRLIVEPEFYDDVRSGGAQVWGRAAYELVMRAVDEGLVREGADPHVFTRVLAGALAGQRFLVDMTGSDADLPARFAESLDVVLAGIASEQWLERHRRTGWPDLSAAPES